MIEITMPRLSDTMEEGAISVWHKKPGDRVEIGDILVEIETDKATMEYEAYEAGTLAQILVPEGELVSIGAPIALIDDGKGEAAPASDSDASAASVSKVATGGAAAEGAAPAAAPATRAASAEPAAASTEPAAAPTEEPETDGERRFASPLVRKIARENHLDISQVHGTGPGGRIIRTDVAPLLEQASGTDAPAAAAEPAPAASVVAPAVTANPVSAGSGSTTDAKRGSEQLPLTKVRRVIARRLGEAHRSIPTFTVTAVADAEELVKLRAELNSQLVAGGRPKVSVNDLLVRASALALREHPLVNASYVDDTAEHMLVHSRVNVGIAVASEAGLMVPVITDADQKTVTQLGVETKRLAKLANDKKLSPDQMSGGTFTISNLGMFGVEQFTAIINPPEGAILAVGGTVREPVVVGDEIVARYRMRYTLTADHRIIDGALAAQFLQSLTRLIENPWTIIA